MDIDAVISKVQITCNIDIAKINVVTGKIDAIASEVNVVLDYLHRGRLLEGFWMFCRAKFLMICVVNLSGKFNRLLVGRD